MGSRERGSHFYMEILICSTTFFFETQTITEEFKMTIKPMPDGGLFGTLPSPEVQPDVVLTNWSVTRVSSGTDHWDVLLGRCTESNIGRLSTPLIELNAATAIAITRSGREYLLSGPPGTDEDAIYVYEKQFGHVPHERKDVTEEYWLQIQDALKKKES
jgi:hypothetical protein